MTNFNLNKYKTFIFDCDGVILNSNKIKSTSFRDVTKKFGDKESKKFYNYHIENGGVSRNEKFKYFVNNILNIKDKKLINNLIYEYSNSIYNSLLECEVSNCLSKLKNKFNMIEWFVLTGGNENEVKKIFKKKNIFYFESKNIYGSPKSKYENYKKLKKNKLIKFPIIFFGDSKYDYQFSKDNDIDFIFVNGWTEVKDWDDFCKKNVIKTINNLCELI